MDDGHYTITLDQERGLVHVVAVGEFVRDLGDELITNARKEAVEHQYNILCDVRGSNARVALADWYYLPRRLAVYRKAKSCSIKTAIIVATGKQEKAYRFFETVTRNLGLNIRIFFREEAALEWLRSENEAGK
jgi:hypothetical protein